MGVTLPQISKLDHLVLTVSNIRQSVQFYHRVLGMRVEQFDAADGTNRVALVFGDQKINLHAVESPFLPNAHCATVGSADLCFLSDDPLSEWKTHFAANGVAIKDGPVKRTGATGAITSLYIRDPDGNLIEVSNRCPQ